MIKSSHDVKWPVERNADLSFGTVELARRTPGCLDFSVGADSLDPRRVNVRERWTDRESLDAFRGSGHDTGDDASPIRAFRAVTRRSLRRDAGHTVQHSSPNGLEAAITANMQPATSHTAAYLG
ncbi:putative quinol monooxygenase [Rhodococcus sp. NPDC058521]|uniref:putative quinol monooxygenase n=1 Tax=Rhodococcus sp. NPDC058521 TaxID=3346536 RepID=UPI00365F3CB4